MPHTPPDLSAFGAVTPRQPLAGGHRNAVWLAEGPQGLLVAKSCRHTEAALRWLDPVHAAARAAGLAPPAFLTTSDGRLCAAGWTLETFAAGRAATAAETRALASRLGHLHAATAGIAQRPGHARAAAVARGAASLDGSLAALPAPLARRIGDLLSSATGPASAIHADFTAANLILTATGPVLIDWDEARADLASFDRDPAGAPHRRAWEVLCCWQTEPARARRLARDLLHC